MPPIPLVEKCRAAVADANARWLDETGEAEPPLCENEWQLVNHLAKWAFDAGYVDRIVYRGDAVRLLSTLPAESKRDVWGEALWYLDVTLPERFHPIHGDPTTGPAFVAWLGRVWSGAGGRVGELVRDWAWRRGYLAKPARRYRPAVDVALAEMADWSAATVADALAEARRILDFTAGAEVDVLDDGTIRATPADSSHTFEGIPA